MSLIVAENLEKTYINGEIEVRALREVNVAIEPASFVSFVGPSGSGKTTLLNLIGCLDRPTSGDLEVAGVDVTKLSRRSAAAFRGDNIGFVFQDFNLIPVLTAYENIEYPLLMVQSVPSSERKKRVLEVLEAVGITDQKDKYPNQLSGGQKQRVAVARALVIKPKLVLADEPTANLDHDSAYTVIGLMRKMKDESGTTFVFSTHDEKVVKEVEVIYKLEDGAIVGKDINRGNGNG